MTAGSESTQIAGGTVRNPAPPGAGCCLRGAVLPVRRSSEFSGGVGVGGDVTHRTWPRAPDRLSIPSRRGVLAVQPTRPTWIQPILAQVQLHTRGRPARLRGP